MGKKAPERPEADRQQCTVIAWLRTPEGEAWSEWRISSDLAYWGAGAFGDVIGDSWGASAATTWPEPLAAYDLDCPDEG